MPLEEISLILQLYIVLACPLTQDTHQLRQPMTGNWHLMMFSQSRKPIQPQLLQDSISSNSGTTWSITNLEFMNRVDEATPNETTNGSSCYLPHLCVGMKHNQLNTIIMWGKGGSCGAHFYCIEHMHNVPPFGGLRRVWPEGLSPSPGKAHTRTGSQRAAPDHTHTHTLCVINHPSNNHQPTWSTWMAITRTFHKLHSMD